ncbi:unnamed protein product [Ambrosiozyma monospora]|uniref:Unnamed protein product n=1 Tax=Ambrosiozyma monospora TaxID=43982 RepID=A0ACB5SWE7_AMBMO|nr:unnamed protein product [Ambrosiozyma monospora]
MEFIWSPPDTMRNSARLEYVSSSGLDKAQRIDLNHLTSLLLQKPGNRGLYRDDGVSVDEKNNGDVYYGSCRVLQESLGDLKNMVIATTYKTSRMYFGNKFDETLNIKGDDEVVLKIFDCLFIGRCPEKKYRCRRPKYQEQDLLEKRKNIPNEVAVYKHIWNHNAKYKDSVPEILKNVSTFPNSSIMVRFQNQISQVLMLCLRNVEWEDEEDRAKVDKEVETLARIGVRYWSDPFWNFLYDPNTEKVYIMDFECATIE